MGFPVPASFYRPGDDGLLVATWHQSDLEFQTEVPNSRRGGDGTYITIESERAPPRPAKRRRLQEKAPTDPAAAAAEAAAKDAAKEEKKRNQLSKTLEDQARKAAEKQAAWGKGKESRR